MTDTSNPAAQHCFGARHVIALIATGVLFSVFHIAQWSLGYIDFGDGNYLYIGQRIAEGAVVYRDILAPQPPCHLFLGALIWKICGGLDPETTIYVFRSFSLVLQLLIGLLTCRLAWMGWGKPTAAVLAAAVYWWLPISTWWSLGYQSEPLETFFLLAMIVCALRGTRGGEIGAGIFAALSGLTNATAAPFLLVLIIYMAIHAPARAGRMAGVCVILAGLVTGVLHLWTDGAFLVNVVLNQVGTYPDQFSEFISYALSKLSSQGANILMLEGGFICLGLLGLARMLKESPMPPIERGGLAWFCLATLGSILYVTKGGTMDYIFSLGAPAVAILSSGELAAWLRRLRSQPSGVSLRVAQGIGVVLLLILLLVPGLMFYRQIALRIPYELNESETDKVVNLIRRNSKPGDTILAPPFYAVRADRRIWHDYSELFIWIFKYRHDLLDNRPDGEGWSTIRAMGEAIARKELPLVCLEMDQTGIAKETMLALQAHYQPLHGVWQRDGDRYLFQTRNTRLAFFIPAADLQTAKESWEAFKQDLVRQYGADGVQKFGMWLDTVPQVTH